MPASWPRCSKRRGRPNPDNSKRTKKCGGNVMAEVFGQHRPKIPYQPVADLLARHRERDPRKLAIVDLDQATSIGYGALEAAVTDIASALKSRGVGKGGRVLLL